MMFDVYAAVSETDQIFLELNEAVQWDIDIRSDAEKINLDLEKLNVASIDIECDVAKIDAKLSSLSPSKVFVNVFSDICDIQFSLPKDSGYEITSSSDVTSINTDNKKIAGLGEKSYRSANFETARQILFLYIFRYQQHHYFTKIKTSCWNTKFFLSISVLSYPLKTRNAF